MSVPSDTELLAGFSTFVDAARRLEASYAALQERAAAVDLELAATNRRLHATLAEREAVFEALPVGVAAFAADGAPIWSNREADRLAAVVRAAGLEPATVPVGEVALGAATLRVDRVPLPDRGTLLVLEDRSRVAGLEREVRRLDRLAGLSELALGVAHEIKNPLNGVLGYASLLDRCEDPATLRRYGGRIREGLDKVDRIVRAMLAFARPSVDGGVRDAPRELGAVVADAAREAGLPAGVVTLRGAVDRAVDGVTLGRVLANLFRNAAEAVVDRAPRLEVEVRDAGDRLEIDVADDGPGVAPELRGRLFDPFVSSKADGHGLGLALAARVLSFLGGSIELVPADGRGARFRIALPTTAPARSMVTATAAEVGR